MAEQVVESLVVEIKARTTAMEKGLAQARYEIEQLRDSLGKVGKSAEGAGKQVEGLGDSTEDTGKRGEAAFAAFAAAATVAFGKIVQAIKGAIDAANAYTSAITGLQALAEGTGQDFNALSDSLDRLTADGLLPVADAAAALKNLLARGFSADEAITILERLKDAAAFGRQGALSLGEAVRSATEGIKNENSVLVDNAGVTKNISVMWAEYADQIGKSVTDLTTAEKRQAEFNGIVEETKYQLGDAARYAETFAGSQAALEASTTRAKAAIGSAVSEALQPFVDALVPLVDGIAEFAEQNPELTAGIVAATAATVGIVAAFTAWQAVTKLLGGGLSALGGSLGLIVAAGGLLAGLVAALAAAQKSAEEMVAAAQELNAELGTLSKNAQSAQDAFETLSSAAASTDELTAAKNRLAELFPELVLGYDAEGNAILASNERIKERIALLQEEQREAAKAALQAAAAAEQAANAEREQLEATRARLEAEKASYEQKLGRGETQTASLTGTVDNAKELQRVQQELLEVEKELAEVQNTAGLAREQQYAALIGQLGELSEAQQLLAQQVQEEAAESGASIYDFSLQLLSVLNNTEAIAEAEAELAAQREKSTEETAKAYDSLADAIRNADGQKIVQENIDILTDWRSSTEETEKAAKALGDTIGVSAGDVVENLDWIRAYAEGDEEAFYKLLAAEMKAIGLSPDPSGITGSIQRIIDAAQDGQKEAMALLALLQQLGTVKVETVGGVSIPKIDGNFSSFKPSGSRGGSSAKKQTWWEKELAELEHLEAMGEEVADKQIAAYERILATAKLTTEERWRLEEELYALQQEATDSWFESQLELYQSIADLDEEEVQRRIQALEELLTNENLNADERAKLEKELTELKLATDGDYLEDYIDHLNELLAAEELNAEQREEVYKELADARIAQMTRAAEAEQEALEQAQELAETVVDALRDQYEDARDAALDAIEQQKKAAQEAAKARIEAIKAERDAQLEAIDEEIEALNELLEAKKREEEEESDQDELNRLKAALAYEKDDYNRGQLEQQIAAKEEEIARKKWEADIQAQKDALEEKKDLITEEAEAKIEAAEEELARQEEFFERQKEMTKAFYEERLSDYSLFNEALLLMTDENQEGLQTLLETYWKENITIADVLGSSLYDTFKGKFDDITTAAQNMARDVQTAIANALAAAASASGSFSFGGGGTDSSNDGAGNVYEFKIYNQPGVESRVEQYKNGQKTSSKLAREMGG